MIIEYIFLLFKATSNDVRQASDRITSEVKSNSHEIQLQNLPQDVPKTGTNNSSSTANLLGVDESIIQEEMEWIREMKFQSKNVQNDVPPINTSKDTVKTSMNSTHEKKSEASAIEELERQIKEKIALAKMEESIKLKEQREREEKELNLRIQEEINQAEEMRLQEEEGNIINDNRT